MAGNDGGKIHASRVERRGKEKMMGVMGVRPEGGERKWRHWKEGGSMGGEGMNINLGAGGGENIEHGRGALFTSKLACMCIIIFICASAHCRPTWYHNCENQDEMVLSLTPTLVPRTYANQKLKAGRILKTGLPQSWTRFQEWATHPGIHLTSCTMLFFMLCLTSYLSSITCTHLIVNHVSQWELPSK